MKLYLKSDLNTLDYLGTDGRTPADDHIEPVAETPDDIGVGSVVIIEEKAYVAGIVSHKDGFAILRRIPADVFVYGKEPEEYHDECHITCPYCDYMDEDSFEAQDSDDEHTCPQCGSTFAYERHIQVTYSSSPVKQADVIKIN